MIFWDQNPAYLRFAESILGFSQYHAPGTATWLTSGESSGRLLGIAIFSKFTFQRNCEITFAVADPRAISKNFAKAVAHHVFVTNKLERVTAIIAVSNAKSLNLAARLGFREEGRLRKWFPGDEDAIILGLLRDDCKFLKDFYGRFSQRSDAARSDSDEPSPTAAQ